MSMNTPKPFENQVCLVTGGTRGIGRAIARMLAAHGASVVICGRSQESAGKTAQELTAETASKVKGKAADVRNHEDVKKLFQFIDSEFSGLDVLVNNAGLGLFGKVSEISEEDWQSVISTNLSGAFHCTREALFRFGKRGAGYIFNIASLAGKSSFAGGAAYNASKFGLVGFSEAVMLDSRYDHVRVSTILPGSVATGFGGGGADSAGSNWKIWPEDVAEIVRTLLTIPARTLVSHVEMRPSQPKRTT